MTTPLETPEQEDTTSFAERYSDVLGKVNDTLDQVDWSQMGRIGKIVGIFAAVIITQILIKGILDTINLLPIVPGLLELLGVVVVTLKQPEFVRCPSSKAQPSTGWGASKIRARSVWHR